MSDVFSPLAGFTGTARLFPLPNLVFFPHVLQPLHIFEPRYRQLTADALDGDRLMALVLPRPGWEKDYTGAPPVYSVATLGAIVADQKLDNGRYNILLRGLSRIHLLGEIPHSKLYRKAKAELLVEDPITSTTRERRLRKQLVSVAPALFSNKGAVMEQFRKLLESELPLGALCDLIAFALPLDVEFKQRLLEELDVATRTAALLDHLAGMAKAPEAAELPFPPEFSVN
ncbi:MAG: LON peptidase substrate-binding domain-containing protein [Gemmataceae bacterium]|nr:LON peptidase substrate-binding domain-containing protein [Gemmataceae bacterium]